MKIINDLPINPSRHQLLLSLISVTAIEVGFVPEGIEFRRNSWMTPSMAEWRIGNCVSTWDGGIGNVNFKLACDPDVNSKIICVEIADQIVIVMDLESEEKVRKPRNITVPIGRFIVTKKIEKEKAMQSVRHLDSFKKTLKEKLFLPARDEAYLKSGTNWAYPGLMGLPTELILQISENLEKSSVDNMRLTSRRLSKILKY